MNYVKYEQKDFIGVITIDREKALNALNSEVLTELEAVIDSISTENTRCIVVTGAGQKSFVAGADIGEMSNLSKAEGKAFGEKAIIKAATAYQSATDYHTAMPAVAKEG